MKRFNCFRLSSFFALVFVFFLFNLIVSSNSYALKKVKLLRIVDADTIVVYDLERGAEIRVRIYGIDTPEKYRSRKAKREYFRCRKHFDTIDDMLQLGRLASREAYLIFQDADEVYLEPISRGYYGRLIARVYLKKDGQLVDYAKVILKKGYSCVYFRNTDREYVQLLKEADENRRGLFRDRYRSKFKCICRF